MIGFQRLNTTHLNQSKHLFHAQVKSKFYLHWKITKDLFREYYFGL